MGRESGWFGFEFDCWYESDDDSDGGGKGKQAEMSKSKEMATVAHSSPPAEPLDSTTVMEEATKEARRKQAKEWDVK